MHFLFYSLLFCPDLSYHSVYMAHVLHRIVQLLLSPTPLLLCPIILIHINSFLYSPSVFIPTIGVLLLSSFTAHQPHYRYP